MHAPVWKRTNPSQVIGLALVLGLAASITLNVVMLTRSDNDAVPTSSQATADLLAQEQRYYAAKETRQNAVEAAAGAQVAQRGALTQSQRLYVTLKADQLNGIIPRTSMILNPALQDYYDRKWDQMDGIVTRSSTSLTLSQLPYVDVKSGQVDGITSLSSTSARPLLHHYRYFDLKSDQMNGIASTDHAAPWQRYVDLKSDQMDGIAPG